MRTKSKGFAFGVAGVASLILGCALGVVLPGACLPCVAAGFIGYVACGRRAVILWHLDERVFDHPHRHVRSRGTGVRLVACLALAAAAAPLHAQQTIFNVPSADVLDPGRVYLEGDELFRPTTPAFSTTQVRAAAGVVHSVEAGVNFGGLASAGAASPGSSGPTASLAVKLQPINTGGFAVTAGGFGLFFLRGGADHDPSGLGYGLASYRIPGAGTRLAVGGWYASAGYARAGSTGGSLASFEQPLPWVPGLTLAADWYSGENAIGYLSPGLVYGAGRWTAYAAYSIKNADSRGNAGLLELGYAF